MGEQTTLTWEEAEKKDKLNSRYFSPESNSKYKLTFSEQPIGDTDSPDGRCVTGRLVEKEMPVWDKGVKTDKLEKKVVLQLAIDSIDGQPCQKIWNVKNQKMRSLFRTYGENNLLTKKIFIFEIRGEMIKQNYQLSALDKPSPAGK